VNERLLILEPAIPFQREEDQTMDMTDVQQAQEQLVQLVARAAQGEEIVIAAAGKPIAKLVPYAARQEPRIPGRLGRKSIHRR